MKTFQKGVFVEGAQKATLSERGENIDTTFEALKEAVKPFVLTNENVVECFKKKPMFIEYDSTIYVKQDLASEDDLYYSCIYLDNTYALSIHRNGTIEAEIAILAKSEDIKPIYCHPVNLIGSSNNARLTILIFNNNSTPFTLDTLVSYIDSLYTIIGDTIRIMASGCYTGKEGFLITSCLGKAPGGYFIAGNLLDGSGNTDIYNTSTSFKALFTSIFDGVNRIN